MNGETSRVRYSKAFQARCKRCVQLAAAHALSRWTESILV
jgi:hypothetical protein